MVDFKNTIFLLSAVTGDDAPKRKRKEIALFGRSNVGKSTFINLLTGHKLAFSAKKAGKTRFLNYFLVDDFFYLVDTPGYGFQAGGGEKEEDFALLMEKYCSSSRLSGAVLLLDIRRELNHDDEAMLALLQEDQIPFVLIFTKEDKATRKEKDAAIRLAKTLDCPYAFSSMKASPSSSRSLLLSLLGKCD